MAIVLIVEDGSVVANANTYVDLATQKAFLETHPYGAPTLALDDEVIKAGMVSAFRGVNTCATFRGEQVEWDQEGAFPRTGLDPVPSTAIPKQIKTAQMELLRFVLAGDRDAEGDAAAVKREKVDVIEVEYQAGAKKDLVPEIVQRLIKPFVNSLADEGSAGSLPTSSAVFMGRA